VIICPSCKHTNLSGAVFCTECGTPLVDADYPVTHEVEAVGPSGTAQISPPPLPAVPVGAVADNWVTLHLLDTGEVLPLADHNEFTMGRSSEGQPVVPDIDLTPYDAYGMGVSRLHAVIRRGISDVVLMDLDSSNGTFINGKRLTPNEEWPLSNGDVVALGRLKIQILLKAS
jgi:hypothetical protein